MSTITNETNSEVVVIQPNTEAAMALRPKEAIGKTIGNFTITRSLNDGIVVAKCNRCGDASTGGVPRSYRFYKIKSGHTKSCGCRQRLIPEDHIGKKYQMLTMTGVSPNTVNGAKMGLFTCECGNKDVELILNKVINGKVMSCGCMGTVAKSVRPRSLTSKEDIAKYNKVMDIWVQMLKRVYQAGGVVSDQPDVPSYTWLDKDKEHPRYHDYGARGLKVDKRWWDRNVFYEFYVTHVKPGESLDRMDNNLGYGPDNCRGASDIIQNTNQRKRKDNTSGYKGITYTGHSYSYFVRYNGVKNYKAGFDSIPQAAIERNILIVTNGYTNTITALPKDTYKIKSFYNTVNNKYNIAAFYANGILLSKTLFDSRDDVIMNKVIRLMREASGDTITA